jgi:hypothetical protein
MGVRVCKVGAGLAKKIGTARTALARGIQPIRHRPRYRHTINAEVVWEDWATDWQIWIILTSFLAGYRVGETVRLSQEIRAHRRAKREAASRMPLIPIRKDFERRRRRFSPIYCPHHPMGGPPRELTLMC